MVLTTTMAIGFKVPDEYTEMQSFIESNNIEDWVEESTTQYIYFTKKQTVFTDRVGDIDD